MDGSKTSFGDKIGGLFTPTLLAIAWWSIQTEIADLKTEVKEIRKLTARVEILEKSASNHDNDLDNLERYFFIKPEDTRVPKKKK